MNKRDIINKLNADLGRAKDLMEIMREGDVCERLEAQAGYIATLLEWIEFGGKV